MSDSVQPHRRQPTRLPRPWDSPGKNTGVGCHFLLHRMKVKSESEVAQSCPTLSDPMDCSLPGSSVHGILQARGLEWGIKILGSLIYTLYSDMIHVLSVGKGMSWRRQWHPTAVLLPGKSHGQRSLLAAVHGVMKSWTQLSDFTFTFHFHALEKEMATHSSVLAWRIPGTGKPGGLPSMGLHRVGHD